VTPGVTPQAIGNCTSTNPRQISNLSELNEIKKFVNLGGNALAKSCFGENTTMTDSAVYLKLTADIDLGGKAHPFEPIGTNEYAFYSNFDGGGHIISNLYINMPDQDDIGFFGAAQNATISNLAISSAEVNGNEYAGVLVGAAANTKISSSWTSGKVFGHLHTGGFVGFQLDGVVTNSYSTADVTSVHTVGATATGGLIGDSIMSSLSNTYASGKVEAINTAGEQVGVGGLVGVEESGTNELTISNSAALNSSVTSETGMHRLVGLDADGSHLFNYTNNYAFDNMAEVLDGTCGAATVVKVHEDQEDPDRTTESKTLDAAPVSLTELQEPVDTDQNFWQSADNWTSPNPFTFSAWNVQTGKLPLLNAPADASPAQKAAWLAAQSGTLPRDLTQGPDAVPPTFKGTGTSDSPYMITTPKQLAQLACLINTGAMISPTGGEGDDNKYNDPSKYYKLGADIDLAGYGPVALDEDDNLLSSASSTNWLSIYHEDVASATGATTSSATGGWVPIGCYKYIEHACIGNGENGDGDAEAFHANFDGDGYYISNLHINRDADYQGLFGKVVGGTLKNFGVGGAIIDGSLDREHNIGGVFGSLASGANLDQASHNLLSIVDVSGSGNVGSLGGNLVSGTVNNAVALGAVTQHGSAAGVTGAAGGLIGSIGGGSANALVMDAYATGNVSSTNTSEEPDADAEAGGLVGRELDSAEDGVTATIDTAYAKGIVKSSHKAGGVLGGMGNKGVVKNTLALNPLVNGVDGDSVNRVIGVAGPNAVHHYNYGFDAMVDGTVDGSCGSGLKKDITDPGNLFDGDTIEYANSDSLNGNDVTLDMITRHSQSNIWHDTNAFGSSNPFNSPRYGTYVWEVDQHYEHLPILTSPKNATDTHWNEFFHLQDGNLPADLWTQSIPFGGAGTSDDPFTISNAKQLAQFGCLINGNAQYPSEDILKDYNSSNTYFKLTNNIDLKDWGPYDPAKNSESRANWESIYIFDAAAETSAGVISGTDTDLDGQISGGWVPVGNDDVNFMANFDGAGHTVANLKITAPEKDNVGLFGVAALSLGRSTIKSVGIVNLELVGNWNTGGLVGRADQLNIQTSYSTGNVRGLGNNVGGLVGTVPNYAAIENSYSTANVQGGSNVGGLLGLAHSTTVNNSYAQGDISGGSNVGGLIGNANESSTIENSFTANHHVSGNSSVSRVVGTAASTTLDNNFAFTKTVVEINCDSTCSARIIDEGTGEATATGLDGLGAFARQFNQQSFYVAGATDNAGPGFSMTVWHLQDGWLPVLGGFGAADSALAASGFEARVSPNDVGTQNGMTPSYLTPETAPICELSGDGTVGNPWQITTIHELICVRDAINSNTQPEFYNALTTAYVLTTDIDLAYGADDGFKSHDGVFANWKYGEYQPIDHYGFGGWEPIGHESANISANTASFKGTFDGQGYVIKNLFIDRKTQDNLGFFGNLSSAVVKNLGVVNAKVVSMSTECDEEECEDSGADTGIVVGHAGNIAGKKGSQISSVWSSGEVRGVTHTAGLVGELTDSSSLDHSFSTANVVGYGYSTGGLVGNLNYYSTISSSFMKGDVSGKKATGGIVGSMSWDDVRVINSYSTGEVSGDEVVGGISGDDNSDYCQKIENTYATGNIQGLLSVGGISGKFENDPSPGWKCNELSNSVALNPVVSAITGEEVGRVVGTLDHINSFNDNWALDKMVDGKSDESDCAIPVAGRDLADGSTGEVDFQKPSRPLEPKNGMNVSLDTLSEALGDGGADTPYNFWQTGANWVTTGGSEHPADGNTPWTDVSVWELSTGGDALPVLVPSISAPYPVQEAFYAAQTGTFPKPVDANYTPFHGDGSVATPFQISNAKQLAQFACVINTDTKYQRDDLPEAYNNGSKHYKLTDDIDLTNWGPYTPGDKSASESNWTTIYADKADAATGAVEVSGDEAQGGWVPIGCYKFLADGKGCIGAEIGDFGGGFSGNAGAFRASLDGGFHVISGLKINRPGENGEGLFGMIFPDAGGTGISNLGVYNADIKAGSNVGILTGEGSNEQGYTKDFTISNVWTSGKVSGSGSNIGGISGSATNTSIINSYSTADISGNSILGGLAGNFIDLDVNAEISSSYAKGNVRTWLSQEDHDKVDSEDIDGEYIGGLVGQMSDDTEDSVAEIVNSVALNPEVYGYGRVKRIVGSIGNGDAKLQLKNNYALTEMTDGHPDGHTACGLVDSGTIKDPDDLFNQDDESNDLEHYDQNGKNIDYATLAGGTSLSSFWTNSTTGFWNTEPPANWGDTADWTFGDGADTGVLPTLVDANGPSEFVNLQDNELPVHFADDGQIPFEGEGTGDEPFEVGTAKQLAQVACLVRPIRPGNDDAAYSHNGEFLTAAYTLTDDIDLSEWGPYDPTQESEAKDNWSSVYLDDADAETGAGVISAPGTDLDGQVEGGWVPIGDGTTSKGGFDGVFENNGKTITGMKIVRGDSGEDGLDLGLFGEVSGGHIYGLDLEDSQITVAKVTSETSIGCVSGANDESFYTNLTVEGCNIRVGESSPDNVEVGSLRVFVGSISGEAVESRLENISSNNISINVGATTGNLTGDANIKAVGGLVGAYLGLEYQGVSVDLFENVEASGVVNVEDDAENSVMPTYTGGIVGHADELGAANIESNVAVKYSGTYYDSATGGIFGSSFTYSRIMNAVQYASVDGYNNTGALIGSASQTSIGYSHSYATSVSGHFSVGGLVGQFEKRSKLFSSFSNVGVTGNRRVGGLVGTSSHAETVNAYSNSSVEAEATEVGALIGYLDDSTISKTYATGDVSGQNEVGGVVGAAITRGNHIFNIEDSVALSEHINTDTSGTGKQALMRRILGFNNEDRPVTLFNNFSFDEMRLISDGTETTDDDESTKLARPGSDTYQSAQWWSKTPLVQATPAVQTASASALAETGDLDTATQANLTLQDTPAPSIAGPDFNDGFTCGLDGHENCSDVWQLKDDALPLLCVQGADDCASGTQLIADQASYMPSHLQCLAGYYELGGICVKDDILCPAGQYRDQDGNCVSPPCPAGQYRNWAGACVDNDSGAGAGGAGGAGSIAATGASVLQLLLLLLLLALLANIAVNRRNWSKDTELRAQHRVA
jgi:hypothetical protein